MRIKVYIKIDAYDCKLQKTKRNKKDMSKITAFLRIKNNIIFEDVVLQNKDGMKALTIQLVVHFRNQS